MVLEVDQIDVVARAVFCDLQEIDHTCETGASRQLGCDVCECYAPDRRYFDEPVAQSVVAADLDVRALPYTDAAGDFAAHDGLAKTLREHHQLSVAHLRFACYALFPAI